MSREQNQMHSLRKYLSKRSLDYKQYGRYLVKDLTMEDMPYRFVSYLGDLAFMFSPIMLWDMLILLSGGGYLNFKIFSVFMFVVEILLYISIIGGNALLMVLFKGQTFGKIAMDFKVVGKQNRELPSSNLLLREIVGFGLPLFICYWIFGLFGVLGFSVLNGIVVLIDKQHRSIIDFFMKCKIVRLNEKGKKSAVVLKEQEKQIEKVIPAENKYDLHVYSSFSHDGEKEVEDLFKMAKAMGIEALSICDHNSVKANLLAEKIAHLYGISYVSGINIDCMYEGYPVRILGYGINSNDERLARIEYENLAKERIVSERRIELFESFTGFKVNIEQSKSNRFRVISKEMIARNILSNSEYRKTKLLAPYLIGNKKEAPIQNFIKDFFEKGAPAYVPIVHPDAKDMIALIKACNGVAVVAHPMHTFRNDKAVLEALIQEGIEGLELFTPYHKKEDIKYLIDLVKKYHLEVTAGSEYHGKNKPAFVLGNTHCPKDIEQLIFKFVERHKTL